jgi:Fic family protein
MRALFSHAQARETDLRRRPGRSVPHPLGYRYFVPDPLPPPLEPDLRLLRSLSEADRRIGRLAGEGRRLPNPHVLVRPFVRREAVDSSRIEGTQATLGELLAAEAGAVVERSPDELREVGNYVASLESGLRSGEVTLRTISKLHRILMSGSHGIHTTPGRIRTSQNWIGPPLSTLRTASYVPPAPAEMRSCLRDWGRFLNDRSHPPLIRLALLHYQFEAIHPFLDGNGRIGRLLIVLLLVRWGILPAPLLYLSAFFEVTRPVYYSRLRGVTEDGDWSSWIRYFLKGVELQSEDALRRSERIDTLLRRWRENARLGIDQRVIDLLAANPYLTIQRAARRLGVAFTTLQRAVERLRKQSVLRQVGASRRNRVYCATSLLSILEEPPRLPDDLPDLL